MQQLCCIMESMAQDDTTNRVFRALGDTTRRKIVDELALRERQSLFEICTRIVEKHEIGLSRQAITRHLTTLENAGVVRIEWKGTTKLHSLETGPIEDLAKGWLGQFHGE